MIKPIIKSSDFKHCNTLRITDGVFDKKYVFDDIAIEDKRLRIEHLDGDAYCLDSLKEVKQSLYLSKSKLSDKNSKEWDTHTFLTSLPRHIVRLVRRRFNPELCTVAWCKFYEIISTFPDLLPNDVEHLHSVHLCEAPGAFVASLNHYLKTKRVELSWSWVANTLNPFFEENDRDAMINDDLFIEETLDNWDFGANNSGNIMNKENILSIWKNNKDNPVYLVTADGSISCYSNPGEQELKTSRLHFSEMVCALGLLKLGGGVVLKMFTLFEHTSISILFILKNCFTKLQIFKPASSKGGNSEVYVIAIGFRGVDEYILNFLLNKTADLDFHTRSVIKFSAITKEYENQIRECTQLFSDFQMEVIEENLRLWNNGTICRNMKRQIDREGQKIAREWIHKFQIQGIDHLMKLTPFIDCSQNICDQQLSLIYTKKELDELNLLDVIQSNLGENVDVLWRIEFSKPNYQILNSRFSDNRLLNSWSSIIKSSNLGIDTTRSHTFQHLLGKLFTLCNVLIDPDHYYLDLSIDPSGSIYSWLIGSNVPEDHIVCLRQLFPASNFDLKSCNVDQCRMRSFENSSLAFDLISGSINCSCIFQSRHKHHTHVLWEVYVGLSLVKQGGSIILKLMNCLERLPIGIAYILHNHFEKLTIVASSFPNELFLVAQNYSSWGNASTTVKNIREALIQYSSRCEELSIIQLVNPYQLQRKPFYNFMANVNNSHLMHEIMLYNVRDNKKKRNREYEIPLKQKKNVKFK